MRILWHQSFCVWCHSFEVKRRILSRSLLMGKCQNFLNFNVRGMYEYTYMSHHYCCYRYITDEALSTTAYFDRHGHPHDVYRL